MSLDLITLAITVGFLNTSHTVDEYNGQVKLQVGVISGSLQRELILVFSIIDLDAFGKLIGHSGQLSIVKNTQLERIFLQQQTIKLH